MNSKALPKELSVIVTYRCPMRCSMCHTHSSPSRKKEELLPGDLEILPALKFVNITGGEPFVREDLAEFVKILYTKASRIVISTSGSFPGRVIRLAGQFPHIGIRVSLEGLSLVNDRLRGRQGSFDRGLKLLLTLRRMGVRDIGFGITLGDANYGELLPLYELARGLDMEFATAAVHNSFYFHKHDNRIKDKQAVCCALAELVQRLLLEKHPKSWFRAYFNMGLMQYVQGGERLLPCEAGSENFFIDPYGEVYPCNGLPADPANESMGNIRTTPSFTDLWFSEKAEAVRNRVRHCPRNCWMIGTAAPVMKKYLPQPFAWVLRNKLRLFAGKPPDLNGLLPRPCKSEGGGEW